MTARKRHSGCRIATFRGIVVGGVGLAFALPAFAGGVHIVSETQTVPPQPVAQKAELWLHGASLRMRVRGSSRGAALMIFDGEREILWTLDEQRKQYLQVDEEEVSSLGGQLSEARRGMEEQMASLPEAERKQMMELMAQMAPDLSGKAPPLPKIVKTDERKTIDGREARRVDVVQDGRPIGEIWLTDWKAVGFTREDFDAFRRFAAFQRSLLGSLGPDVAAAYSGASGFDVFDQLDGFPLLIRRIGAGGTSETRFTRIEPFDPPKGFFAVPAGYTRAVGLGGGAAPPGASPPR